MSLGMRGDTRIPWSRLAGEWLTYLYHFASPLNPISIYYIVKCMPYLEFQVKWNNHQYLNRLDVMPFQITFVSCNFLTYTFSDCNSLYLSDWLLNVWSRHKLACLGTMYNYTLSSTCLSFRRWNTFEKDLF